MQVMYIDRSTQCVFFCQLKKNHNIVTHDATLMGISNTTLSDLVWLASIKTMASQPN